MSVQESVAPPTDTPTEPNPVPWSRRLADRAYRYRAPLIVAVALAPFFVLFVKLFTDAPYLSWGDDSLLELQTRDIGRHWVALGPYSRFGFAHPGPALFYLFVGPYWLFGGTITGLNAASLLINATALIGIAWIAWRRGRTLLLGSMMLAIGLFLAQNGLAPAFLRLPWNPYVTVLPLMLLLLVAWELSAGTRWALPVACAVGSFLVQTHLGYIPEVAALTVVALLLGLRSWWEQWQGSERRALLRALAAAAAVTIVSWALPIAEQVFRSPGNFSKIATFQLNSRGDYTLTDASGLVLRYVGRIPAWLLGEPAGFDGTSAGSGWMGLLICIVSFAALVLAWRLRARAALRFGVLGFVALGVAVIATMKITGPWYQYLVRWLQMPAIAVTLVPIVVLADPQVRDRFVRTYRGCIAVVLALLVSVSALNAYDQTQVGLRGREPAPVVGALAEQTIAAIPDGIPVFIDRGVTDTHLYEYGVAVDLVRNGHAVWFTSEFATEVGNRRTQPAPPEAARLVFATAENLEAVRARLGAEQIAQAGGIYVFRYN